MSTTTVTYLTPAQVHAIQSISSMDNRLTLALWALVILAFAVVWHVLFGSHKRS